MDWALAGFVLSVATLGAVGFFRKRIQAYLGRAVLEGVRAWGFVEEEVDGKVVRKLSPAAEAELKADAPLLFGYIAQHIKFQLPKFGLPEGADLKQIGMAALANKVASGRKLKIDDAMPLVLGYAKDWLDKSGFGDVLAGGPAGAVKKGTKVVENPFLKEGV